MDSICKLKGVVQHYSWGGTEFIPSLLGIPNTDNKPFAEYWLGAHPKASSICLTESEQTLQQAIEQNATAILGERVAATFGSLPYLFKILDVRQMLSIQVHPSRASAVEGFEKENESGVALTAHNRNYKDQNHKPELMLALSDFWLLHGFKNNESLTALLDAIPQLNFLKKSYEVGGYKTLYEEVMTMPQQKVNEILASLLRDINPAYEEGRLDKSSEHFWAARAAATFYKGQDYDRGIFSIYLFNLLHLQKGEGIYQPAGLPHAYLEGHNVEVMANSDNVLRAGLTDKHIDVPELMKHVIFEATNPNVIRTTNEAVQRFEAPVDEFLLTKYEGQQAITIATESATILFLVDGEGTVTANDKTVSFKKGEAVLAEGDQTIFIVPQPDFVCFTVMTPLPKN